MFTYLIKQYDPKKDINNITELELDLLHNEFICYLADETHIECEKYLELIYRQNLLQDFLNIDTVTGLKDFENKYITNVNNNNFVLA